MLIISMILNIVKENSSCFKFLSGGVGNFSLKKTLTNFLEILWQRRRENMFWKSGTLKSHWFTVISQILSVTNFTNFFLPVAQSQSINEKKNCKLPVSCIISRIVSWDSTAMPNSTIKPEKMSIDREQRIELHIPSEESEKLLLHLWFRELWDHYLSRRLTLEHLHISDRVKHKPSICFPFLCGK